MGRRIRAATAVAAGGAALAATAYRARFVNPYRSALERVALAVPASHRGLAGLRIGFVTDTHVGPHVSVGHLERAVELVASQHPDLILLGGDYISDSPRHAERAAQVLGRLARTAPLGAVAVLGNHDVSNDADRVVRALHANDILVLRNASHRVETDRGDVWIAGVDEHILSTADPEATFAGIPTGAATLALWHEPDWAEETAARGAFAQLSGHSHGGQLRIPCVGAPFTPPGGRRYVAGLNQVDGMPVYTSRGLGFYRPPIRVNCPPEVTLVTLAPPVQS